MFFAKGVPDDVNGFDFPRQVWFLNRWIRHGDWYPDTKLRLFRRTRGACAGQEPHEKVVVEGRIGHLKSPLHHYTYDSIQDQISTLNRFSTISAEGGHFSRSRAKVLFGIFAHAPFRFFRCYFLKLGFLDGLPGLIIAVASSFGTFIKYAKLWEKQINSNKRSGHHSSAGRFRCDFFSAWRCLSSSIFARWRRERRRFWRRTFSASIWRRLISPSRISAMRSHNSQRA